MHTGGGRRKQRHDGCINAGPFEALDRKMIGSISASAQCSIPRRALADVALAARLACEGSIKRYKGWLVSPQIHLSSAATISCPAKHPAFAPSFVPFVIEPYHLSFINMYSPIQLATLAIAFTGLANALPGNTTPEGYGTTTTTPKGYGTTKTTKTTATQPTCSVSTIWTKSVGQTTKPVVKTTVITLPGKAESTCKTKQISTDVPSTIVVTKTKDTVVSGSTFKVSGTSQL